MKFFSVVILMLICQTLSEGQIKLKKITAKHQDPYFTEVYFIKKSEPQIKHGDYKKLVRNKVEIEGQYEHDKKVGPWKFYNIWTSELSQIFNYSTNEVEFDDQLDHKKYDTARYNRPLTYLGGMSTFYGQWSRAVRYPANARRSGIQGKVYLKAVIDKNGKVESVEIIEGIGYGCDKETLRSFKSVEQHWLPALDKSGNTTISEITLPFTFKLG